MLNFSVIAFMSEVQRKTFSFATSLRYLHPKISGRRGYKGSQGMPSKNAKYLGMVPITLKFALRNFDAA
jgi:hypothetical protein